MIKSIPHHFDWISALACNTWFSINAKVVSFSTSIEQKKKCTSLSICLNKLTPNTFFGGKLKMYTVANRKRFFFRLMNFLAFEKKKKHFFSFVFIFHFRCNSTSPQPTEFSIVYFEVFLYLCFHVACTFKKNCLKEDFLLKNSQYKSNLCYYFIEKPDYDRRAWSERKSLVIYCYIVFRVNRFYILWLMVVKSLVQ